VALRAPKPVTEHAGLQQFCVSLGDGFALRDQRRRPVGNRRSPPPRLTTEDLDLQDVFNGSDGTRTRDLRSDRPVLVVPGSAGIGGDSCREQGFREPPCGDPRASAGACGGLLRDERGMTRCLSSERAVPVAFDPARSAARASLGITPGWRWLSSRRTGHRGTFWDPRT
jgi:hypothetical protein